MYVQIAVVATIALCIGVAIGYALVALAKRNDADEMVQGNMRRCIQDSGEEIKRLLARVDTDYQTITKQNDKIVALEETIKAFKLKVDKQARRIETLENERKMLHTENKH